MDKGCKPRVFQLGKNWWGWNCYRPEVSEEWYANYKYGQTWRQAIDGALLHGQLSHTHFHFYQVCLLCKVQNGRDFPYAYCADHNPEAK